MAQPNISINDSTEFYDDIFNSMWNSFGMKQFRAERVFIRFLSVIEIPVMILTLIALCFLIKSHRAAPVFVIHLILSDLIQVICIITAGIFYWKHELYVAYLYSLIVGVYFMTCVAFERYLLVSHPIWYKSHHSLKLSSFVSLIVWFVPLIFAKVNPPYVGFEDLRLCIAFLIPYPIIILCFAGTWRGLSHAISLTSLKRKLILGSLFLVLLTYTFLILPFVIGIFAINFTSSPLLSKFIHFTDLLVYVNPLADCLLYLFMRPDVGNLIKSVHCCCRNQSSRHNQDEHSVVNPQTSCTTVVYSISAQKPASHSLNTCSSV